MGQERSQGEAPVAQEQTPEQIREEIEEAREQLGDTAAALAEKADVKARTQAKVDEVKQTFAERRQALGEKASSATPAGAEAAAGQVTGKVKENPLPAAVAAAFVGGLLVGRLSARR